MFTDYFTSLRFALLLSICLSETMNHHRHEKHFHQLQPARVPYNLQALPILLQTELRRQLQAAKEAIRQMEAIFGYPFSSGQSHRQVELLLTMNRHLNSQAATFIRFQVMGQVLPLADHHEGDFRRGSALFVVDRAAVFNAADIEGQLDWELANAHLRNQGFSEHIIAARHQVLALVRGRIADLRNWAFYLGLEHDIVRGKEEAIMLAATQFMGALQEMSLAVHHTIEPAFFNGY